MNPIFTKHNQDKFTKYCKHCIKHGNPIDILVWDILDKSNLNLAT